MPTLFWDFPWKRMWPSASGIGNDGQHVPTGSTGSEIFLNTDFAMTKAFKRKFSMSSKIPFGPRS